MPLRASLLAVLAFALPAGAAEPQKEKIRTDLYGDPLPEGAIARFGTIRMLQVDTYPVAFGPDGKTLASAGKDGIRIWNLETGKVIPVDHLPTTNSAKMTFTPDGAHVIGDEKGVRIINPKTGDVRFSVENAGLFPSQMAIAPNGKSMAIRWTTKGKTAVTLHDLNGDAKCEGKELGDGTLQGFCYSGDGTLLAGESSSQAEIQLWDAQRGKLLHSYVPQALKELVVHSVRLSPDGRKLASYCSELEGDGSSVHIWDTESHKEVASFKTEGKRWYRQLCFSADGIELLGVSGGSGAVVRWDAKTGKVLGELETRTEKHGVLSADGKSFAVGVHNRIRVWDVKSGKMWPAAESYAPLHGIRFLGDKEVGVYANDGAVHFWDRKDGRLIRKQKLPVPETEWWGGVLSPDGKLFALRTQEAEKAIILYDLATGKELRQFGRNYESREPLAFSPDSKTILASGYDTPLELWDVATGQLLRTLEGKGASHSALSPDGRLAVSGFESPIRLWELSTGKIRHRLRITDGKQRGRDDESDPVFRFSPNGRFLAVFRPTVVLVFSLTDGAEIFHHEWTGARLDDDKLGAVSSDGRWLVCSSNRRDDRGCLHLLDLTNLDPSAEGKVLTGHADTVNDVAFTPDGKQFVSVSEDGTALVWDMERLTDKAKTPKAGASGVEAYWADLCDADTEKAGHAMNALGKFPEVTIPLLKARLRPVETPDANRLRRLVADLGDEAFDVRDKANRELEQLDDLAEPALKEALKGNPSAEAAKRIRRLLQRLEEPLGDGEQLRRLRAVELLERIGTPEAAELLKALAKGAPAARVTKEAKASLERLTQANEGKRE
jgi:WD40 repeat protein